MHRIHHILLFVLVGIAPIAAQVDNPFSIIRSAADTIEKQIVPTAETEVEEKVSTKLEVDNPFTVSHIPIRKNQYKEIERLAISNRTVEENISLAYLPLWIIIGSLCLLAYLLFNKKDHLAILVRSIMNDNFMKMTNYEQDGGRSIPYLVGYLIFILNVALFLFLYVTKQYNYNSKYLFIAVLGAVCVFFIGKHLVNTFFSWVFHLTKESRLYNFTIITFHNLLAVIFLILNIFLVFGQLSWLKPISIAAVLFFLIALLSRYYKGVRIGQSQLNNYFVHFFLYFCAFEFSPWIIVFTLVRDFF